MKFSVDAWDPGYGTSFQETAETLEGLQRPGVNGRGTRGGKLAPD